MLETKTNIIMDITLEIYIRILILLINIKIDFFDQLKITKIGKSQEIIYKYTKNWKKNVNQS